MILDYYENGNLVRSYLAGPFIQLPDGTAISSPISLSAEELKLFNLYRRAADAVPPVVNPLTHIVELVGASVVNDESVPQWNVVARSTEERNALVAQRKAEFKTTISEIESQRVSAILPEKAQRKLLADGLELVGTLVFEKRNPTPPEQAKYDALQVEFGKVKAIQARASSLETQVDTMDATRLNTFDPSLEMHWR